MSNADQSTSATTPLINERDHSHCSNACGHLMPEEKSEPEKAETDSLYERAVEVVREQKVAFPVQIQRHLRIGYNRALRLIERMEREGVVTEVANKKGFRQVVSLEGITLPTPKDADAPGIPWEEFLHLYRKKKTRNEIDPPPFSSTEQN